MIDLRGAPITVHVELDARGQRYIELFQQLIEAGQYEGRMARRAAQSAQRDRSAPSGNHAK